jgi:hypothetical protein
MCQFQAGAAVQRIDDTLATRARYPVGRRTSLRPVLIVGGKVVSKAAVISLCTQGFGVLLATQRIAELHKDAVAVLSELRRLLFCHTAVTHCHSGFVRICAEMFSA